MPPTNPALCPRLALRLGSLACFGLLGAASVHAQAMPTATRDLRMDVFAGINGTDTGLPGDPAIPSSSTANNVGITAGYDLGFRTPFPRLHTALEVRGTYPVSDDGVDAQKNIMAGLRLGPYVRKLRPYGDAFYGRGSITYAGFGYPVPNQPIYYTQSISNIFAGGGGLDISLNERFAIKFDVQLQRYSVPVTTSGHLIAKSGTVALIYRFAFDRHTKLEKTGMPKNSR